MKSTIVLCLVLAMFFKWQKKHDSPTGKEALFEAIGEGDIAEIRKLLAGDRSLANARDEHGFTALMQAVSSTERTPGLVKLFIDAGSDVNAKTEEGYTALHMMIDVNGPTGTGKMPEQIARMLVDAGAKLEVRQHWGWTPLMRAAVEGLPDELRALVKVGGDVNRVFPKNTFPENLSGRTTLMATVGSPDMLEILIQAGADVKAKDAHGQTALEYARQRLAEAPQIIERTNRLKEKSAQEMQRLLKQYEQAGIDVDEPMEQDGTTLRQFLESVHDIDYDLEAELKKSIALLEQALANHGPK